MLSVPEHWGTIERADDGMQDPLTHCRGIQEIASLVRLHYYLISGYTPLLTSILPSQWYAVVSPGSSLEYAFCTASDSISGKAVLQVGDASK